LKNHLAEFHFHRCSSVEGHGSQTCVWRIADLCRKSVIRHTQAEGLANYALVKEAIGILVELGVDRSTIPEAAEVDAFEARMRATAIEITTSRVQAEAEPAKEEVAASDSVELAKPTEPSDRPPESF
jgi:hypothetical protein